MSKKATAAAIAAGTICHFASLLLSTAVDGWGVFPSDEPITFLRSLLDTKTAAIVSLLLLGATHALVVFAPTALGAGALLGLAVREFKVTHARMAALTFLAWNASTWIWAPVPFFDSFKWAPIVWFLLDAAVIFASLILGYLAGKVARKSVQPGAS